MEIPLFFGNKNYKLFGILHEPDRGSSTLHPVPYTLNKLGVVFCHPFAEEKLICHRIMVNFARTLCDNGYYVLRFDHMGHGDSTGNFEDTTVTTQLSDIGQAVDYLRKTTGVQNIGLLGLRFGATLASLFAETATAISFLILIAPVIKGGPYIDECLRSNLATQMAVYHEIRKTREHLTGDLMKGDLVNVDGYHITKDLYLQMQNIDLAAQVHKYTGKVLIIQPSKKGSEPFSRTLQTLYSGFQQNTPHVELSRVIDHFFWTESTKEYISKAETLYNITIDWLKRHF